MADDNQHGFVFVQSRWRTAIMAVAFMMLSSMPVLAGPYEWTKIDGNQTASSPGGEVWIELAGDRAPGSAFTFTSVGGVSILFDPWHGPASGSWGLWFADDMDALDQGGVDQSGFDQDAVLSPHANWDRDTSTMPDGTLLLDRLDGAWALADVRVIGFADNNIVLIIMGGTRLLIWGEGLPDVDTGLWSEIGVVDVLILPIDDTQTSLSYDAAAIIIDRLAPDVIIPGLYLAAGVDATQSQLGTAEEWTRRQNYHTILREPILSITGEWVHSLDRHVQYFGNHHLLD